MPRPTIRSLSTVTLTVLLIVPGGPRVDQIMSLCARPRRLASRPLRLGQALAASPPRARCVAVMKCLGRQQAGTIEELLLDIQLKSYCSIRPARGESEE
eukprot:1417925-Rhodomonas_salina.1